MGFECRQTDDDERRDETAEAEAPSPLSTTGRGQAHVPVRALEDGRIHARAERRPGGGRFLAVCGRVVEREPLDFGAGARNFEALWSSERREARTCCSECATALGLPPRPPVVRPFAAEVSEPGGINWKVLVASAAVGSITLLRVAALVLRHR